jgi:hypothetical protein
MSVREAATYLGYIVVFSAVVAWAHFLHAPRETPQASSGHSLRMVGKEPAAQPAPGVQRVTASVSAAR